MLYNRRFQFKSPMEQYFYMLFEPAANTTEGQWMSAAAIHQRIKKVVGSSVKENIIGFGRVLSNMDGLMHHRTMTGMEYLAKEKQPSYYHIIYHGATCFPSARCAII